jgi:hypothetical protein
VSVPGSANIGEGDALTVSAWIRPAVNDVSMWIVTKGRASTKQWTLHRIKSNNRVGFLVSNSTGTMASATSGAPVATDSEWHHVAGVYDGQHVYLYVDGDRSASTSAALQGPIRDEDLSVCIAAIDPGSAGDCAAGDGFNGDIDDVRIFNRALTTTEIRDTMAVDIPASQPGLTGYWMFDEGEGQLALDSSPSGLDALIGDTATIESSDPDWVDDAYQTAEAYSPVTHVAAATGPIALAKFQAATLRTPGEWTDHAPAYGCRQATRSCCRWAGGARSPPVSQLSVSSPTASRVTRPSASPPTFRMNNLTSVPIAVLHMDTAEARNGTCNRQSFGEDSESLRVV